jgi:hypothetical protein
VNDVNVNYAAVLDAVEDQIVAMRAAADAVALGVGEGR